MYVEIRQECMYFETLQGDAGLRRLFGPACTATAAAQQPLLRTSGSSPSLFLSSSSTTTSAFPNCVSEMRVRTLEIRWHDGKPISTCDFQPIPFKKARPPQDKGFTRQSYRLATGGEDNHVRVSRGCGLSAPYDTQQRWTIFSLNRYGWCIPTSYPRL